jgi:hypothetical protein
MSWIVQEAVNAAAFGLKMVMPLPLVRFVPA